MRTAMAEDQESADAVKERLHQQQQELREQERIGTVHRTHYRVLGKLLKRSRALTASERRAIEFARTSLAQRIVDSEEE